MNATVTRPDSPGRLAVAWGLIRAGAYLALHRKVTLPGYGSAGLPLPVPVNAIGHDERVAELRALAKAMHVKTGRLNGSMTAVRRFGPVHLRAHVSDAGYTRHFTAAESASRHEAAAERLAAA